MNDFRSNSPCTGHSHRVLITTNKYGGYLNVIYADACAKSSDLSSAVIRNVTTRKRYFMLKSLSPFQVVMDFYSVFKHITITRTFF